MSLLFTDTMYGLYLTRNYGKTALVPSFLNKHLDECQNSERI